MCIEMLSAVHDNMKCIQDEKNVQMIAAILDLCAECLSYDFVGTLIDDATDETQTVQVPSAWRTSLIGKELCKIFIDLYIALPAELASKVRLCFLSFL